MKLINKKFDKMESTLNFANIIFFEDIILAILDVALRKFRTNFGSIHILFWEKI